MVLWDHLAKSSVLAHLEHLRCLYQGILMVSFPLGKSRRLFKKHLILLPTGVCGQIGEPSGLSVHFSECYRLAWRQSV
jgi:hypothetical protein